MSLSGRVAIITGSSRGLGSDIARRFLADGAFVMLCGRDRKQLEEQFFKLAVKYPYDRVAFHLTDISNEFNVERMFAETEAVFDRIDILVNNAAVLGPVGNIDEIDWGEFSATLAIDLTGAANCIRRAIAPMKRAGGGKIININGGGEGPLLGADAYVTSKAALARLTENLAPQLAPHNIAINAVSPGPMATDMLKELVERGRLLDADGYADLMRYRERGATPSDLAVGLCAWLASTESDGLTGRLLAARYDPWPFSAEQIAEIMGSDLYTMRRVRADVAQRASEAA